MVPCQLLTWCVLLVCLSLVHGMPGIKEGMNNCKKKQILTFNTGLTPSVPNYKRRGELIPKALQDTQADVVCLQEVWFERDMKPLLDKLRKVYPYSWSPIHDSTTSLKETKSSIWASLTRPFKNLLSSPCKTLSFTSLMWCALKRCITSSDKIICIVRKCSDKVFNLPQECLTCLVMARGSIRSTFSQCLGLTTAHGNEINMSGLLILSKLGISNPKHQRYFPGVKQLIPRAYITAKIQDVGTVVCTHLTATFEGAKGAYVDAKVQAAEGISSWEEQQKAEIERLITSIHGPHILLGDLNTGPGVDRNNVDAELPKNYAILTKAGYIDEYIDNGEAKCISCASNILRNSSSSYIIDHVLVKDVEAVSSTRVLQASSSGELLSDHYGVKVGICST